MRKYVILPVFATDGNAMRPPVPDEFGEGGRVLLLAQSLLLLPGVPAYHTNHSIKKCY